MPARGDSFGGAIAGRGIWRALTPLLLVAALGCGLKIFNPKPPTVQIVDTFGQLEVEGTDDVPAHYIALELDPATFSIPAPVSGTVRYLADLNGLTSCLELRPQVTSELPPEVEAELEQLDESLPAAGGLNFALCNFENGGDELRDAVQELFEAAFTRDGRTDDPQEAAEKFLGIQPDPAGDYVTVEVWTDDPNNDDSALGVVTGGRLELAVYTSEDLDLDEVEDVEERTFVNPSLYLAPYLRETPVGEAFNLQRPRIDKLVVEVAQAPGFSSVEPVELDESGAASETVPSAPVRIRILLDEVSASPARGATIVPYEVRYELNEVTRTGAAITSRDLRSHGVGHLNEFKTHDGATPDHVAPDVAGRLYASQSARPTDTYWLFLPLDATSPVPADPPLQNLTTATFNRELDLAATDGTNRVFPPGEYELSVKIKEPFSQAEDEYVSYFDLADGALVPVVATTTAPYFNHDDLTPTTDWPIDYEITGTDSFDRIRWTVRRKSDLTVIDSDTVMTGAKNGTFNWRPAGTGAAPDPDEYEIELEVLDGADVKGVSLPYDLTIYRMSITPATGAVGRAAPGIYVPVNNDDDNANGTEDSTEGFAAEDDLVEVSVNLEPPLAGTFELSTNVVAPTPQPVKVWTTGTKTTENPLPDTVDPSVEAPPYTLFLEGVTAGQFELRLQHQTTDGTTLASDPYALTVPSIEVVKDTNGANALAGIDGNMEITAADAVASAVDVALWDLAFRTVADAHGGVGTLFNEEDTANIGASPAGSRDPENFIGRDSKRFYFRLSDAAGPAGTVVGSFEWFTETAARADDDHPATDATLTLTETGAGTHEYVSQAVMVVTDQTDRDQATHTGLGGGGLAAYDARDHRTRQVCVTLNASPADNCSVDGYVVGKYSPAGAGGPHFELRWPIFDRSPDFRRTMTVQIYNLADPHNLGHPRIPLATVNNHIRSIRQRYWSAGINTNVRYNPATDDLDLAAGSGVDLTAVTSFVGGFGTLAPSPDQTEIIGLAANAFNPGDANAARDSDTVFVLLVSGFSSVHTGQSFPDGWIPAASPARNFVFVDGVGGNIFTTPHEIGHIVYNETLTLNQANGTDPGWANGGHYGGPSMPQNVMYSTAVAPTPAVTDKKRWWNDTAVHVIEQIDRIRGTRYIQP